MPWRPPWPLWQANILVNNAGIGNRRTPHGEPIRLEDLTEEQWDQVQEVNNKRVFLGTRQAIPEMRKAGGGSIINMSSIIGLVGSHGSSAYHASKGAVRLLTKATAVQCAAEGIRCNSVHPGAIDRPMTQRLCNNPRRREETIRGIPIGKIGTTEDIAYGVLFLASDDSSCVTGSELVIDGGTMAQ